MTLEKIRIFLIRRSGSLLRNQNSQFSDAESLKAIQKILICWYFRLAIKTDTYRWQ